MTQNSIDKLFKVWASKNTINKPINKEGISEMIEQIASLFAPSSYYYLIMDFKNLDITFISNSVLNIFGVAPDKFKLKTFFSLIHPEDLEKLHEKEYASLTFKLNHIPKEDITKYKTVYLLRMKDRTGAYRTVLHQSKAIALSEDEKVGQTLCVHTDITHLNPAIDHKISFISQECPSYYSLDAGDKFKLVENSFKALFTKREKEIITLMAKGKNTDEIAIALFISAHTVLTHKKNILKKACCKNSAELITTSIREGII